jgi:hypothetical protein
MLKVFLRVPTANLKDKILDYWLIRPSFWAHVHIDVVSYVHIYDLDHIVIVSLFSLCFVYLVGACCDHKISRHCKRPRNFELECT